MLLFGLAAAVARVAVAGERLYDQARWRGQSRLHVVVAGYGDLGRACVAECVMAGIAGDLAPPRITILDRAAEAVEAQIAAEWPELGLSAELAVSRIGPNGSLAAEVASAEAVAPLTAVFLCLGDDATQATALLELDRLRRGRRGLAPVLALSETAMPLATLACPTGRRHDGARRSAVRCGWPGPVDMALVAAAAEDAAAKRMHEAYRAAYGGVDGSRSTWEALPESFRAANRRGARHLPQKLWTLGLTWPGASPDPGAVAPEPRATIVEPCSRAVAEDAPMRRLARLEHDRWNADRRLDGWSFGSPRDDARRLHPSLIPFDDPRLTDAEIDKDIGQIRFTLATAVRTADDGATAPLVLGVIARPGPSAGIGSADALALSTAEPWRPVVVLTALGGAAEVATAAALLAALRGAGRRVRLVIAEAQFGEPVERRIGEDRFASLVGDAGESEISIVTIATGDPAAAGWTDAGAAAVGDEALAKFVASRAAAVVSAAPGTGGSAS